MNTHPVLNLQDIVDSYDDPAVLISDDYEIICANSAYLDLYYLDTHHHDSAHLSKSLNKNSIKSDFKELASSHPHCFEVSHRYTRSCDQEGESCPLQLAKTTKHNQRVLHVHHTRYGEEHVDVSLYPVRDADGKIYFLETMKTIKHASPKVVQQVMVGKSPLFNKLLDLINRVAQYDISVLLQGESGTGKELVAHAVHQVSQRHSSSCVTVECSGLSESLFESELFGHEKGAFTGAINKKIGLVEEAEGGTLFLDEIGDVPLSLQVKLLRLLETRTFRRVGGVEQLTTDFRLICATHKNLKEMVKNGDFREDLYYRISTFPVSLPALRDRREDLLLLVNTILERITGNKILRVSDEVFNFFKQYLFPGNIRQLRNILEYARVMTDSDVIEIHHLPDDLLVSELSDPKSSHSDRDTSTPAAEINSVSVKALSEDTNAIKTKVIKTKVIKTLEQHERDYLLWLQHHFKGDNKALSKALGISERTLYRKMK